MWSGPRSSRLSWSHLSLLFCGASRKPPAASGEIVQVWAHPRHVETSGLDANGAPMAKESFDEVLLFAHVKLKNDSKYPLVLENALANVSPADGILSVSAGSTAQYDEVFLAYPELAALHSNALPPRTRSRRGRAWTGTAFWVFRRYANRSGTRARSLNFTFSFQYQPSLVLAPHTAVMEQ